MRESTRDRVLRSALKLIAVQGTAGTSIAAVAADAGLSPAGVMYHFPSKAELLIAVQVERDRIDTSRFALPTGGLGGLAVLDRLAELASFNAAVPGLVQAFTVLDGEAVADGNPHRSWFTERYRRIVGDLAESLQRGQASGEIRADVDCREIAAE
ncbi:TetR/AcrR family transcriptional regulator, partial [Kitasatospora indigofera]|uniref:TetR/AcrR family transcriptional regulator n=1 Tax=Kitasatospora indigofera TaxID=67307 RepID=UPI003679B19F